MRISVPKGSYHSYCRNKNSSRSVSQTNQIQFRNPRRKEEVKMEQFDNFETYLMFLQKKEHGDRARCQSSNQRPYRTAQTSRPQTQILKRNKDLNDSLHQRQKQTLIKPFFPFFRCRIESVTSPPNDGKFRISNTRFKLKYRIIEENMGKND